MIKFLQREFGYLTNNVSWRKWVVIIVFTFFVMNIISSFFIERTEPYEVSRFFLIFSIIYTIYTLLVNILAFKSSYFIDIPKDISNQIVITIISSLWTRVQVCAVTMTIFLAAYQYIESNIIFAKIFQISILLMIYYNLTLQDSISVFIKMRVFGGDDE